jgi:predicted metal-dependent peptidase
VNEIVHAVTSYEVEETYIIYCDTEISVEKYTDRQMHKFKVNKAKFKQEIHDKIAGGGGTSFIQPFQYLKAKKIKPDAFIYFTDGEGLFPSPSLVTFPTMWVIIDDVDRSVKIPSGLGGRLDIISNGGKGRQVGKSQFGESFIHRLVKKIII